MKITIFFTLMLVQFCWVHGLQRKPQQRNQIGGTKPAKLQSTPRGAFPLAYVMSSGHEDVVGAYREEFTCQGRDYGYYGDVANDCKMYHICVPPASQYTFFCNNGTVFDQKVMNCVRDEDATPCGNTEKYYALNQNFGVTDNNALLYLD